MNRFVKVAAAAVLVTQLVGCASTTQSLQRKFTRKKAEKHVPTAIYFNEGPYQKKFSNDYYYKTHYTLWRSWHDDLLDQLGGNEKKVSRCAQEALGHLTDMASYLKPEQKAGLDRSVADLNKVYQQLDRGGYGTQEGTIRVELERIRRVVSNDYYYDKMKDFVLPDSVDLGADEARAPEAQ